jgi:hypothetical protein
MCDVVRKERGEGWSLYSFISICTACFAIWNKVWFVCKVCRISEAKSIYWVAFANKLDEEINLNVEETKALMTVSFLLTSPARAAFVYLLSFLFAPKKYYKEGYAREKVATTGMHLDSARAEQIHSPLPPPSASTHCEFHQTLTQRY